MRRAADELEEADDKQLVAWHVAGDDTAFGVLVRRHRDRLWAVAVRTLGEPEEAADALQDALLAACRRADSYRGEAAVTTWLHRIVVNACLDRLRRRKVRQADTLPADFDLVDGSALPGDPVLEQEDRLDVLAALRRLTAEQRAAIVLVDMEGYPVEEAALILGCPVGTVKSRCARGRARLVPLLAHLRTDARAREARRNQNAPPSVAPTCNRAAEGLAETAPLGGEDDD